MHPFTVKRLQFASNTEWHQPQAPQMQTVRESGSRLGVCDRKSNVELCRENDALANTAHAERPNLTRYPTAGYKQQLKGAKDKSSENHTLD